MNSRERLSLVLLVVSIGIVGYGCLATYGVLREYADVCPGTGALAQAWVGGAGLGPYVLVVAGLLAFGIASLGGRRLRLAAVALVVLALLGATVAGAEGVADKRTAYEADPTTYGSCGGASD